MLKLMRSSLVVVAGGLLAGCFTTSINPFYTDGAVTDAPAVHGEWYLTAEGDDDVSGIYQKAWVFSKGAIKTFKKGVGSTLDATYFKVEGALFVDLFPGEPDEGMRPNSWWTAHVLPVHSMCKVDLAGDTLRLIPLDIRWVTRQIKTGEAKLDYVSSESSGQILTSSSKELMAFLKAHVDDPGAFPEDNSYVFRRERPVRAAEATDTE